MKPFEEQYTAWIDGRLTGEELTQFERELPDHAAAEADREEVHRLARVLRDFASPPALASEDFFSHQLFERIAAENRGSDPAPRRRRWFFSLPQMAWAGAFSLVCALGLFYAFIPPPPGAGFASVASAGSKNPLPLSAVHVAPATTPDADDTVYDASIIEATPQEPGITATSVYSKAENMTVLWLDGLDYLPASYKLE